MAHFTGIGTIATDVLRRETRNGVLASFRFASGAQGRGRVWITVEAWGHTAGVLNTHGHIGRGVTVAGRLTQNTWRDKKTGEARCTLIVTAGDLDFLDANHDASRLDVPNHVLAVGRVDTQPVPDETGERALFKLASGHAGAKTGRLWLPVELWGRTHDAAHHLRRGDQVSVAGRLGFRSRPNPDGEKISQFELSAFSISQLEEELSPT